VKALNALIEAEKPAEGDAGRTDDVGAYLHVNCTR
jgi:hypothetical protein